MSVNGSSSDVKAGGSDEDVEAVFADSVPPGVAACPPPKRSSDDFRDVWSEIAVLDA